jgi:predicted RNA-binding protein with PIN domain
MLIDGHNLIGADVFADIHLSDEDDEAKLVARLKVWKSRYRGKMTVIFDRGIPGGIDARLSGAGVEVVFAAGAAEADDLIRRRLRRRPRGLVLVSNDEKLIQEAVAHGVQTMRGSDFVDEFTLDIPGGDEPGTEVDVQLSKTEVDEWLALFASDDKLGKDEDGNR